MKLSKLVAVLALIVGLAGSVKADAFPNWGNVFDSLASEAHFHFLDNAKVAYFYDVNNGESRGATVTSFLTYGFLDAEAGYLSPSLDRAADRTGSPLLGGSVNFPKLANLFYPEIGTWLYGITPQTAHRLMNQASIGFAFAHDFIREEFTYGVYTGIKF